MRMSGRLWAALLPVLLVVPLASAAGQPPPVHQVGERWSAWTPPATPEGARVYEVQAGDTLWDLAQRFLGDPYLWPQIWERNSYIEDSHWIYPGDPLLLDFVSTTTIDQIASLPEGAADGGKGANGGTDETGDPAEGSQPLRLDRSVAPPEPLGSEDDIYCAGFIGDEEYEFERRIIGSEYENLGPRMSSHSAAVKGHWGTVDTVKLGLATGDIVYLDGGVDDALSAGQLFTVVTPQERVHHPNTGRAMGRFYKYSGRVRVLSVQEQTAIGEIVHSCEQMFVGATLQPFVPQPVPLARRPYMRGVNDPRSEDLEEGPMIVRSTSNLISLGQGHVIYLDRGAEHDLVPGDIYTIYRLNEPGMPAVVIGEAGILSVEAETASAKILESRYTVHVGDRLDLETN